MAATETDAGVDIPDAATERTVTANGQQVHYLTAGDGDPTLLLLHGGIIDAAHVTWGEQVGPLAEHATVVAPDLPGYGASPLPDGEWSVPHHVDTVAAMLDELDVDDAVLAGVSMGGGVAVGVGLAAPARVDRLVAFDPFALGGGLPNGRLSWLLAKVQVTNHAAVALMRRSRGFVERSVNGLCYEGNEVSDVTVDRVFQEVQRPNAGAAFRKLRDYEVTREGYRTDYSPRLGELAVPARFVHGREDDLIPLAVSERAHERVPDSELFVLEECGHIPPLELPERSRELLREVL
ncbi:alpha/beta fold hydrolase [Salinirussus salinus]|uniref:alpha/beta fold hydrolase n=1 Tax=Salinirussus salinus TaxID=1198300 RepID=UPI00135880E5|nr:alpha/beta hydrolase [Salinirussus salinus]